MQAKYSNNTHDVKTKPLWGILAINSIETWDSYRLISIQFYQQPNKSKLIWPYLHNQIAHFVPHLVEAVLRWKIGITTKSGHALRICILFSLIEPVYMEIAIAGHPWSNDWNII